MKKLKFPTTTEERKYINNMQQQNKKMSKENKNENKADRLLKKYLPDVKFSRQSRWGYRIFDFWSAKYGIAIELDGSEHNPNYDYYRDEYNFRRSGILVLRMKNSHIDKGIKEIADIFFNFKEWKDRRLTLGIIDENNKIIKDNIKKRCDGSVNRRLLEKYLITFFKEKVRRYF